MTRSIPAYYRILLRGQLTRGRMIGLATLAGVAVLFAVVARSADDPEGSALFAVADYGIGILVPLAAVLVASPLFGTLVEDRLLVYLALKPVPRWHLATAAFGAAFSVLVPLTALPVIAAVLITGETSLLLPAVAATVLGVAAYVGLYLWLGLRFGWGMWLALLYMVLWENTIARFGNGPARFSIRSYLVTILERGTDRELALADRAASASILVPCAVALIGVLLTTRALASRDID